MHQLVSLTHVDRTKVSCITFFIAEQSGASVFCYISSLEQTGCSSALASVVDDFHVVSP
jgi:hypothetical protein